MKIVHLIGSLAVEHGGPPRVVLSTAAAHVSMGHSVAILTYRYDSPPFTANWGGVAIRILGEPTLAERLFPRRAVAALREMTRDADVLHIHGVWEVIVARAVAYANRIGLRVVVTPHGMIAHYGMQKGQLKKRIALLGYVRAELEGADVVHVLTERESGQVRNYVPAARTVVVPNAIHQVEFMVLPSPELFARCVPDLAGRPYVLFLARLDHVKGLDLLIDGFAHLTVIDRDVCLVIAGSDYGARDDAVQRIEAYGIGGRVQIVGPISGKEKLSALVGARCLCQPSRHEGFSISVIESLACGTPVVISRNMQIPGLLEYGAGLVVESSADAIAVGLLQYVGNEAKRTEASRAARRLAFERYTWTVVADQVLQLYSGAGG